MNGSVISITWISAPAFGQGYVHPKYQTPADATHPTVYWINNSPLRTDVGVRSPRMLPGNYTLNFAMKNPGTDNPPPPTQISIVPNQTTVVTIHYA
jgi:hypothetical protein